MRLFSIVLIAQTIFAGALFISASPLSAEEPLGAAPQASQKQASPAVPPANPVSQAVAPAPAAPASSSAPSSMQSPATPTPSPTLGGDPAAAVQCNCSVPKDDGRWTGKDWAALLSGFAGILGTIVAVIAILSNGRTSRATTIQKANEAELESLQSKLDSFYGPYLQLSSTNRLIALDLKSHHAAGPEMRVLLILLDPQWKDTFNRGQVALVEEILSIDGKLLDLIQEKSGLVSDAVQPYLWRAASHFRIMKLAVDGKLDNDPKRYAHYVYPRQLDEIIDMEISRIHGRIDLIRGKPMVLHPPASDLSIPDRFKLSDWPK